MFHPHPAAVPFAGLVAAVVASCPLAQTPSTGEVTVRIVQAADTLRVLAGERAVLDYRSTGDPWKPHLAQLCTPAGVPVLRVSPPDHLHHRGAMFALGVDDFEFWGEHYVQKPGRQQGGSVVELAAGASAGRSEAAFAQELDWRAGEPEQVLLRERRRIGVELGPAFGATLLTWTSELQLPAGRATARLWGRPYFGFGVRFAAAMDQNGRFVTADGKPGEVVRGDERLRRGDWCALVADAGGQTVTAVMFAHPDNPRQPTTFFTMAAPFAYLAATLDLAREPIELTADQPLRLRYGLALLDGAAGPDRLAALHRTWVARCAEQDAASARAGRTDGRDRTPSPRNP